MKKKKKLLQVKIDDELAFALDVYVCEHGETTKSSFIRRAIRDRLDRVSSPTYVEPKVEIQIPVPGAPRTYAEKVAMRRQEELKTQWLIEAEADMRRQAGVSQETNMLDDDQRARLNQNFNRRS